MLLQAQIVLLQFTCEHDPQRSCWQVNSPTRSCLRCASACRAARLPATTAFAVVTGEGRLYEFYAAFWERLAPRLLAVLNTAFHSASTTALPLSMRSGRITLLYKGKGADRTQPSSYRPITLLNCDYKTAAAAIAARLGAPFSSGR